MEMRFVRRSKNVRYKNSKFRSSSYCRPKLFCFILLFFFVHDVKSFLNAIIETEDSDVIWAVAGKRADLLCPSHPRKKGDRPILVLWYRDSISKPVYSFDARSGNFSTGERWSNKSIFGERAYFVPLLHPPSLVLEPVMLYDEGLYTCRLDYFDSPTTSSMSRLRVLTLPSQPEILWRGQNVFGSVGPLGEGSFHKLTCITRGGRPPPTLVWWVEGRRAMNQEQEIEEDGEVRSVLTVKASREINMNSLSCHAQVRRASGPISEPLIASVRLNITLPPQGILVQGGEHPVAVDTTLTLVCQTWGSHPPAQLTWWRAGKKMKNHAYSIKDSGNLTTSEIKVVVEAMDHGSTFTCRASNTLLGDLPLVAGRRLNVTYKPSVELRVKISNKFISTSKFVTADMRSVTVKQGSNVQLECSSDANPVPDYIEWHHNGVIVDAGKDAWSLLLEGATKENSGFYFCAAINQAGKGASVSYNIIVEHPPECASGWQKRTKGVQVGRTITIRCRVDALPSDDLSFTWSKMNVENRETKFDPKQIQADGTISRLTITPKELNTSDTLLCRANNSVGMQHIPCRVTLVRASPPDPPFNCTTDTSNGAGSLSVICMEGFDGGFPPKFVLVAVQKGKVRANITRNFPEWFIQDLDYGKRVTLRVYSQNARGQSEAVRLEAFIPMPQVMADQDVEKPKEGSTFDHEATLPLIGILIGTGGVLVIASMVMLAFFCASRKRLLSGSTKPPSRTPSANERRPHTVIFSNSNLAQRAASEASLNKARLIPDPDIVKCIQYGSRTNSHKGLDVLPNGSQVHQSLINSETRSGFDPQNCSSLSRTSSQKSLIEERDAVTTSTVQNSVSEALYVDNNYLLEREYIALKGAIPKRGNMDGDFIGLSKEDSCCRESRVHLHNPQDVHSRTPNLQDVPSRTYVSTETSTADSDLYSCASGDYHPSCEQCCEENTVMNSQLSLFESNKATDSLTYSNACCAERAGPYYVYKHVKCYPHNTYRRSDSFSTSNLQSNGFYEYIPLTGNLNYRKTSPLKGSHQDVPKVNLEHLHNVYEDATQIQPLGTTKLLDTNLKKDKLWSNSCGNFMCSGNSKDGSIERKPPNKRSSLIIGDHVTTYKKFDGVFPIEISPSSVGNSVDSLVAKPKASPVDVRSIYFQKMKVHGRTPVKSSLSEENMRLIKRIGPDTRLLIASNINIGRNDIYRNVPNRKQFNKLKTSQIPKKHLIRLKDVGNSQLFRKREFERLQSSKREDSPAQVLSPPTMLTKETKFQDVKDPKLTSSKLVLQGSVQVHQENKDDDDNERLCNGTGNLDHPSSILDYSSRTLDHPSSKLECSDSNLEHPHRNYEYSSCTFDHPSSNLDHPSGTLDYSNSNLDHHSSNIDNHIGQDTAESENSLYDSKRSQELENHSKPCQRIQKGVKLALPEGEMTFDVKSPPLCELSKGQVLPLKSILRNSKL